MLREHHIPIARTARYFTLGERHAGLDDVWFVCHGYAQLAAKFLRHFEVIARPGRLVVAPEALSRFYIDAPEKTHTHSDVGASWMTREDRLSEIDDYVRYLDALYAQVLEDVPREQVRVHVLGFSQGVATVCRWAAQGAARIDELICWAGQLPHDIDLSPASALHRVRLRIVIGTEDHFATPEVIAEHEARLARHGLRYELLRFTGGHKMDRTLLAQLALNGR